MTPLQRLAAARGVPELAPPVPPVHSAKDLEQRRRTLEALLLADTIGLDEFLSAMERLEMWKGLAGLFDES